MKIRLDQAHNEIDRLGNELGLERKRTELYKEETLILLEQNGELRAAAQRLVATIDSRRSWYEHPGLWIGAGVLLGVGLTVLSAWAIGQAAQAGRLLPSQ